MTPYYRRGNVALWHGDCLDVLPTLESGSVNAIVTSPPYNQIADLPENGSGMWGRSHGGAGFLRKWKESSYQDDWPEGDYQIWQNLSRYAKVFS